MSGLSLGCANLLVAAGEMAGRDGDGEGGAAAYCVGGVNRRVDAGGGDAVRVDAGGGDEMTAGGEVEDADLVRVDVPLGGVEADQADGALRVCRSEKRRGGGEGEDWWARRSL